MPITVRTLETMIRLSTAHAKLRLSNSVEDTDIDIACQLLNSSIFQESINPVKEEAEEDEEEWADAAEAMADVNDDDDL